MVVYVFLKKKKLNRCNCGVTCFKCIYFDQHIAVEHKNTKSANTTTHGEVHDRLSPQLYEFIFIATGKPKRDPILDYKEQHTEAAAKKKCVEKKKRDELCAVYMCESASRARAAASALARFMFWIPNSQRDRTSNCMFHRCKAAAVLCSQVCSAQRFAAK